MSLRTLDRWAYRAQITVGAIAALLVMFIVCWIVAQRYFLKSSLLGADEILLLVAFWMYFLGASAAARDRWQIAVNVVEQLSPENLFRRFCGWSVRFINVAVSGAVAWLATVNFVWNVGAGSATQIYRIPTYWFDAAIIVSLILSFIYYCFDFVLPLIGRDRPVSATSDVNEGGIS